jgi:hypothetical protein
MLVVVMQARIRVKTEAARGQFEDSEQIPPIHVFILYQDAPSGRRAMEVYQPLMLGLGNEFRFTQTMWKFDLLGIPNLADVAAAEMARADMIFVAISDPGNLSEPVKNWFEDSLPGEHCGPGALVLIHAHGETDPASVELKKWLDEIARERRMEFFVNEGASLPEPSTLKLAFDAIGESRHEATVNRSAPPRHWGINE